MITLTSARPITGFPVESFQGAAEVLFSLPRFSGMAPGIVGGNGEPPAHPAGSVQRFPLKTGPASLCRRLQ
jgi:hypothetical protein